MTDTKELIKSARTIADSIHVHSSFQDWEAAEKDTLEKCADALEAAEKRIAELEKQHGNQLTRNIMLRARLPKEGYWIPNSPFTGNCSECGGNGNLKDKYCRNCGAKMRTVTDCHTLEEGER